MTNTQTKKLLQQYCGIDVDAAIKEIGQKAVEWVQNTKYPGVPPYVLRYFARDALEKLADGAKELEEESV